MGTWGWIIAKKNESGIEKGLRSRLEQLTFLDLETDFLNQEAMHGMMKFWKGALVGQDAIAINTLMNPVVDQYYRESEWGF